jgi:pyruvate/2-oxoacid:ferredoxin oxidoreductase beta subunit
MAAHRIPYVASASIGHPQDLMNKVRQAGKIKGTRFIHLLASCPTGWQHETQLTLEVARQGVQARVHPLFEVHGGLRWVLNPMPEKKPVDDYLNMQGRFKAMGIELRREFQQVVNDEWERLLRKCSEQC